MEHHGTSEGNESTDRLVGVWEVYERDQQHSVAYLREEDARNSNVYDEVDLVAKATIWVSPESFEILKQGKPLYN